MTLNQAEEEKLVNRYTLGEEIFNSITHGIGALLVSLHW